MIKLDQIEKLDPFTIFVLNGDAKDAGEIDALDEKISQSMPADKPFAAFNLEKVRTVHSYFIRLITKTHKKLQKVGGQLYLISPNPTTLQVLAILKLDQKIRIYQTDKSFRQMHWLRHQAAKKKGPLPE